MNDDAVAVVTQYVDAYNNRELEELGDLFDDPFQFNDAELSKSDFLGIVEGYWETFPDLTLDHTHRLVDGDYVFERHTFDATGAGEYYGHDVTGKIIDCTEMMLFRVHDGKITEYWYEWDELGFWNQLGVTEDPYQ